MLTSHRDVTAMMDTYIHTYIHTYMHTYIHTYIYIYTGSYPHGWLYFSYFQVSELL